MATAIMAMKAAPIPKRISRGRIASDLGHHQPYRPKDGAASQCDASPPQRVIASHRHHCADDADDEQPERDEPHRLTFHPVSVNRADVQSRWVRHSFQVIWKYLCLPPDEEPEYLDSALTGGAKF